MSREIPSHLCSQRHQHQLAKQPHPCGIPQPVPPVFTVRHHSRSELGRSEPSEMLDLGRGIARHCIQTMVLCWVTASPPNPAVCDSMRNDLQVRFAGVGMEGEGGLM